MLGQAISNDDLHSEASSGSIAVFPKYRTSSVQFQGWNSIFAEKESKVSCLRREGRIWSRLHVDHDLGGKILTYRGVTFRFSIDKEREREKKEGIILVKFKL